MDKKIEIELPDGTFTMGESPINFKFKIGDKVTVEKFESYMPYIVFGLCDVKGQPYYYINSIKDSQKIYRVEENYLRFCSGIITERIKTFEDAVEWCKKNRKDKILHEWFIVGPSSRDLEAYLKLRIITIALNEGWEPTEDSCRYTGYFINGKCDVGITPVEIHSCDSSINLCFKSAELAEYAAKQFKDVYADFCGVKK